MKCRYHRCRNQAYKNGYCYYHDKSIKGLIKTYLYNEEIQSANFAWGREETPPWIGRKVYNPITESIELVD